MAFTPPRKTIYAVTQRFISGVASCEMGGDALIDKQDQRKRYAILAPALYGDPPYPVWMLVENGGAKLTKQAYDALRGAKVVADPNNPQFGAFEAGFGRTFWLEMASDGLSVDAVPA